MNATSTATVNAIFDNFNTFVDSFWPVGFLFLGIFLFLFVFGILTRTIRGGIKRVGK